MFSPALSSGTPATNLGLLAEATTGPLGYERIENFEEAERHSIVAVASPWVSFFDVDNPGAVTEELVDLGKRLSAASRCHVLLTAVWDSDAFAFLLFQEGKQVDGHASGSGALPGRIKKWPPEKAWRRNGIGCSVVRSTVRTCWRLLKGKRDLRTTSSYACVTWSGCLATWRPVRRADLQGRPWPNQQEFFFAPFPASRAAGNG